MRAIVSMSVVAIVSMAMAGCWFYSRPDPTLAGCQKNSYGFVVPLTSTEDCAPAPEASATPSPTILPMKPPVPAPATI